MIKYDDEKIKKTGVRTNELIEQNSIKHQENGITSDLLAGSQDNNIAITELLIYSNFLDKNRKDNNQ